MNDHEIERRFAQIEKLFDAIAQRQLENASVLNVVGSKSDRNEALLTQIDARLADFLRQWYHGNGRPPLFDQVIHSTQAISGLQTWRKEIDTRLTDTRKEWVKLIAVAVGAAIPGLIALWK